MTTLLAKELTLGIKDNVDDISAAFKKMAVLKPHTDDVTDTAAREANKKTVTGLPAKPVVLVSSPTPAGSSHAVQPESKNEFILYSTSTIRSGRKKKRIEVEDQLTLFDIPA